MLESFLWRFNIDEFGLVSIDKDTIFVEYFRIDCVIAVESCSGQEIMSRKVVMGCKVEFLSRCNNRLLFLVEFASISGLFNWRII